jgi:hypothetical protein
MLVTSAAMQGMFSSAVCKKEERELNPLSKETVRVDAWS